MQHFFGSGAMIVTPTQVANATPIRLAVMQEISTDFSFNVKELHGQKSFAVAIGRGFGKITGTAKSANLSARALAGMMFNPTTAPSTTQVRLAEDETATPVGASYTVIHTTGMKDLGVVNNVTGIQMDKVTVTPTADTQYEVNEGTGTYTFNAGFVDQVQVSYTYTSVIASASTFSIDNQVMGSAPFFKAVLGGLYNQDQSDGTTAPKHWALILNRCLGSKWNFQTKQEDFVVPQFDFSCFADVSGIIGTISFEE